MTILRLSLYSLLATLPINAAELSASPLVASTCPSMNAQDISISPSTSSPQTQAPRTQTPQPPESSASIAIGKKLVPDFAEITPMLYRGAQPRKHGFDALARIGIQIVVDVRGDRRSERKEVTSLGMQYVPMHWECSFPKDRIFAQFLTLIRNNPGKKIFVHCRIGDDRTGMMIAAYRMAVEGWTPKRALEEMTNYGFSTTHKLVICPRLSEYEEHFPERFATKPEFEELRSSQAPNSRTQTP